MSAERDDMKDRDAAVTAAYRALSDETTPAELDALVLGRARDAAGAPDRRRARWTQPVAWAAMIVVSLAIVLQVSELPEPPPAGLTTPTERRAETAKSGVEGAAEPAAADVPPERQERAEPAAPEAASGDTAAAARADAALRDVDASAVREAGERVREQSGSSAPRETSLQSAATATAYEAGRPEPACDEAARRTPERWLECIERLRTEGNSAAAERELAELRAAHPELQLP